MPPSKIRLPTRRAKRKPIRVTRRRRAQQSTSSTGHASLIARGVRTLLSVLPGSKLTTGIADFAFKSLGYSTVMLPIDANTSTIKADLSVTGVTALFHLALKDLLFDSFTHGVRIDAATWTTNYEAGRLMSVKISVIPQTKMNNRQGQWAAVFIPFRSKEEATYYEQKSQGMLYEQVKVIPGAKSAPATKPLHLSFSPTARDGRLNFDLGLQDEIGVVSIGFDQTSRSSYGAFALDDFSCTVIVSGVVKLQRPHEVSYASTFTRTIDDRLKDKLAIVCSADRKLQFMVSKTLDQHSCIDLPDKIQVVGTVPSDVFLSVSERALENMVIT